MAALIRPLERIARRRGNSPCAGTFVPGASMMKRPVMNPSYLDDEQPRRPRGPSRWRRVLSLLGRMVKLLFTNVFRRKDTAVRDEVGTPFSRFIKGLLYRLMLVPTVLAVLVGVLVVTATHPKAAPAVVDPVSRGVYYD